MAIYKAYNGPAPTTAVLAAVSTTTSILTLLQLATPATTEITVLEWGISFDGAAAAAGIRCELLTTGAVNATVTAHVAAGLVRWDSPNGPDSNLTLGTASSGYTASAEGTITTTRVYDSQFVQPTGQYVMLWPLNECPVIPVSTFLRVRVKAAAAVGAVAFIRWRE